MVISELKLAPVESLTLGRLSRAGGTSQVNFYLADLNSQLGNCGTRVPSTTALTCGAGPSASDCEASIPTRGSAACDGSGARDRRGETRTDERSLTPDCYGVGALPEAARKGGTG